MKGAKLSCRLPRPILTTITFSGAGVEKYIFAKNCMRFHKAGENALLSIRESWSLSRTLLGTHGLEKIMIMIVSIVN